MKFKTLNVSTKGWAWDPESLVLTRDFTWNAPDYHYGTWTSSDKLLTITGFEWRFKKGFKYNNASMVPSGPPVADDVAKSLPVKSLSHHKVTILWLATLIHDAGYRYRKEKGFPFTRRKLDLHLNMLALKAKFQLPTIYYIAVRLFGWINVPIL